MLLFHSEYLHIKKIKTLIHSFQRYTKGSCNLLGQQHFGLQLDKQNFPRYKVCIVKKRYIIAGLLQQKVITKFYKNLRKPFFGPFFAHLRANKSFTGQSVSFTYLVSDLFHCAKFHRKLMKRFRETAHRHWERTSGKA